MKYLKSVLYSAPSTLYFSARFVTSVEWKFPLTYTAIIAIFVIIELSVFGVFSIFY